MTMNLPMISALDLTGYPVDYRALSDMTPFTYRAGMTYEGLLESIRAWIPNTLIPYLTDNFAGIQDSWIDNVASVESQLEAALQAIATAQVPISDPVVAAAFAAANSLTRAALDGQYSAGMITAPAPTGVAATDTANLQAAFAAAKAAQSDLRLAVSPLGAVRNYLVNQPLTWALSRGSLIGSGHVGIDFSAIAATYVGAALLVQGEQGVFTDGAHLSGQHRIEGIRFAGHNTDTSTLDGVLVADTAGNVDQGRFVACMWYGFRDGITFGSNVWSIDFMKCSISSSHRYGINLGVGVNAGECISLTNTSVYGSTNSAKNAAAIYAPVNSADFRMVGGSLDYNDTEGRIEGGSLTFNAVHIEDSNVGAMFTYTQSTSIVNVSFRDCAWDAVAHYLADGVTLVPRPYLHQILAGSSSKVTLTFDGDKGGVGNPSGCEWLHDSSGNESGDLGITATLRGHRINNGPLLGQLWSLLVNGDFEASSSFVATPYGGWAIPGVGTWTIGAGGQPGAGLKLVAATASTNYQATQRVRLAGDRRPVRFGGKMLIAASTAGSVSILAQFLAEDGTTPILGPVRIGNAYSTVDPSTWTFVARTILPPKGAMYAQVQLAGGNFVGTAYWDQVEAVPC